MAAGLDVNAFGQRLSFFFNAHSDFLEEIAKFRAARRLWARLMRDRYGATNPRAQQLRFHTQTAGSTLTAQQPANNIVRVALQALVGGAGRHAVAALQRQRRGARPAHRAERHAGAAHAADPAARERRGADRRPLRRRLRDRGADDRASRRKPKACSNRFAAWAERSRPSSRASSNAASTSRRIARSGRSKTATSVVVGVNRFTDETHGRPTRLPDRSRNSKRRRSRGSAPCAPGAAPRRVAQRAGRRRPRRTRRREPRAAHHRGRRASRHAGRDCGYTAGRLRRTPRHHPDAVSDRLRASRSTFSISASRSADGGAGGGRRQLPGRGGRNAGRRRRIGQRQVGDRVLDPAAAAAAGPHHRRRDALRRPRPAGAERGGDARGAGRAHLAHLPGADDRAQSRDARRRPDCRGAHRARPTRRPRRTRAPSSCSTP